ANALFGTQDKTLHLQPGQYRINAFYKDVFDVDGGVSHEVVRGRSAVYSIDGKSGETWKLEFERPANLAEAGLLQAAFIRRAVNARTGDRVEAGRGQGHGSLLGALMAAGAADAASTGPPLGAAAQPGTQASLGASGQAEDNLPHND